MGYKVLDILKELPGTNCRECGKPGCFAFATGFYLDGASFGGCPHLSPEKLADMERKLAESRGQGAGKKEASHVQALNHLKTKIKECDFAAMAKNSGVEYVPGPPETLLIPFMGRPHKLTAGDVVAVDAPEPSVWVKVFLYIYVTRATGAPPLGRWATFRELPNAVAKSKTYEDKVMAVASHFAERGEELLAAARNLGGIPLEFGSADSAWLFAALPKVELVLLYWKGGEEFPARTTLLVDAGVLDYLDHEAIVFLAEAFVKLLTGGDVSEVIP